MLTTNLGLATKNAGPFFKKLRLIALSSTYYSSFKHLFYNSVAHN
jgi:hypothetical protein